MGPSPAQGKHVRPPQGHASQPGTLIGSGPLQDNEATPGIEMSATLLKGALRKSTSLLDLLLVTIKMSIDRFVITKESKDPSGACEG